MPSPEPRRPLEAGEVVVTDSDELLFRQVHPQFVDGDLITSQVFKANSGDEGMISVTRASVVTAAEAVDEYRGAGRETAGCFAVTVDDFNVQDAAVIDDSRIEGRDVPRGHAYADFRPSGPTSSQVRQLKLAAIARGWAFKD